jgi:thioredoxin-related protein
VKLIEAFEWVSIDLDQNMTLARQCDVRAIPTFVLLDPDGSQRARIAGKVRPAPFRGICCSFWKNLKRVKVGR